MLFLVFFVHTLRPYRGKRKKEKEKRGVQEKEKKRGEGLKKNYPFLGET